MSAERLERVFRIGLILWLCVCLAAFVVRTLHWRMVNDPAQISYICFLMDHGLAPYKDIIEMNMPGIYLTNWVVIHVLGPGSLAWRIFDFSLLVVAGAAMISIARRYDWLGGFFAAALFALFHGRDGAAQEGQRDLVISVLLVCAYAFLFEAMRRQKNWLLFLFGVCSAGAATIKPPAIVFALFLLVALCWRLYTERKSFLVPVALGLAGMAVPAAVVVGFLVRKGALHAFVCTVRTMLPYYAIIGRETYASLLSASVTTSILALLCLGLVMAVLERSLWNWEQGLLIAGIVFGGLSYFAQGKGFVYHRYPYIIFILLFAGIQFTSGLRRVGFRRLLAYGCLLYGAVVAPMYVARASHRPWDESFNQALQADLETLGGARLSGSVQCIAMEADCDTTLLRMQLVQATGLMYDYYIFGLSKYPAVIETRRRFWLQLTIHPPRVMILGRSLYPENQDNYDKLMRWPEFATYLDEHYTLYDDRRFSPAECGFRGFRVYVRKQDPPGTFAARTTFLPLSATAAAGRQA